MADVGINRISPLFGWLVCLATTVVVFFAGDLLGSCREHETASKVWAILMLILMVATLVTSVWGMVYHSDHWYLVLPLVLATGALFVIPLWLSLIVLGGCDFGNYEF